jgi:HlyD family secretion protein
VAVRRPACAALLALSGVLLAACSGEQTPQVQVVEVVRGDVAEVVDAPGAVAARATSTVSAPADATVEAVLVQDGAAVRKGDVLLRLASPAAQQRLASAMTAQANAAAAQVSAPAADLSGLQHEVEVAAHSSFAAARAAAAQVSDPDLRRSAELQVAEAQARFAAASAAARAAAAQVGAGVGELASALDALSAGQRAQAAAAVAGARATVDALTVLAPIDGIVTLGGAQAGGAAAGGDVGGLLSSLPEGLRGQAEQAIGGVGAPPPATTSAGLSVGSPVSSGTALLTVTDLSGLTVTAEVDETDVLLVKPGVQAVVELDAVPDATYPAAVTSVDVAPTTSTRGGVSYRVRLSLDAGTGPDGEPAPSPLPGMSAVVDLQVRTARAAVAVPTSAVVRDEGEDVVFVVQDDRAVRREVVLGAQGEDSVEVQRGVAPGDRVVARDADRLRDGQPVEQ